MLTMCAFQQKIFYSVGFIAVLLACDCTGNSPSGNKLAGEACRRDAECLSQKCTNQTCASSNTNQICAAGSTQACVCSDGKSGAQTCNSDGKSWGTCTCSNNNNQLCTPNTTQACICSDGKSGSQACSGDGKSWNTCTCGQNQLCTPNTTQACTCQDGKSGSQTCNGDGKSWGTCTCGQNQLCTPNTTQACTCQDGKSGSQTCSSDGKSWGTCTCQNTGKKNNGEGPCSQGSECNGNVCIQESSSGQSYCSQSCTSTQACPTGFACIQYGTGQACGKVRPNAKTFGQTCSASTECDSMICLQLNNKCTQRCDTTSCPSGYGCVGVDTDFKVCVPSENVGKCSPFELQKLSACLTACGSDQVCQNQCYLTHLNEACRVCYTELAQCSIQNNCNPSTQDTCCNPKRKECIGR